MELTAVVQSPDGVEHLTEAFDAPTAAATTDPILGSDCTIHACTTLFPPMVRLNTINSTELARQTQHAPRLVNSTSILGRPQTSLNPKRCHFSVRMRHLENHDTNRIRSRHACRRRGDRTVAATSNCRPSTRRLKPRLPFSKRIRHRTRIDNASIQSPRAVTAAVTTCNPIREYRAYPREQNELAFQKALRESAIEG